MAELKESYNNIIESDEFKKWSEENPRHILQVAFFSRNIKDEPTWSFSFVSNDKLYTFEFNDKIICKGPDDVYIENVKNIFDLDIDKVKMTYEQALKTIDSIKKNYVIVKEVCTVSNNKSYGIHWNMTEITADMRMINIKVCDDGIILKQTEQSLLNLGKWEKNDEAKQS